MTRKLLVSVLMPYRKKDKYFVSALTSLKNQTYSRMEILAEEDSGNEGIAVLLNRLAGRAKGEFLARMDADDISEPDRIEKQVNFLKLNPDAMLVGTWATLIDESGKTIGLQKVPVSWEEIIKQVFSHNPLIHPSWLMRRDWFLSTGGYSESYSVAQDWEFISRRVFADQMENLPEPLIRLRFHKGSVSFRKNQLQVLSNLRIRLNMIRRGDISILRAIELFPNFLSYVIPPSIKFFLRRQLFITDTRSGKSYQQERVLKGLGIVLPMGQNRKQLERNGQWNLWEKELVEYRKVFDIVELFEYRYSNWRRFFEALVLTIIERKRFRRCVVLKAVHLTGAVPCLMAKLLYGIPYVLSYGYRYDEFAAVEKKWGAWLLSKLLAPLAIRFSDTVMVPTKALADYVERVGAKTIEIVPNGVDVDLFKPASKGLTLRTLRTQSEAFSNILFVGRLERQKNLVTLIRAIYKLLKGPTLEGQTFQGRTLGYRLVFVGEGSLRQKLASLAAKLRVKLEFRGTVANDNLASVYRQADIFVLPSLVEGHPKALIEAMSCGLPCLASNILGVNEIITNGKNGLLVEPTTEGIWGGLQKLISSPELRKRLGNAARKTVVEKFDKKKLMEREIKLLKRS